MCPVVATTASSVSTAIPNKLATSVCWEQMLPEPGGKLSLKGKKSSLKFSTMLSPSICDGESVLGFNFWRSALIYFSAIPTFPHICFLLPLCRAGYCLEFWDEYQSLKLKFKKKQKTIVLLFIISIQVCWVDWCALKPVLTSIIS